MRKMFSAFAAAMLATTGATVLTAEPAAATSAYGCNWPWVCFYLTRADWEAQRPTASFQQVTSYYQTLGSRSAGAWAIYNSRNDDGALILFRDGPFCLSPNSEAVPGYYNRKATHIRIMDNPNC